MYQIYDADTIQYFRYSIQPNTWVPTQVVCIKTQLDENAGHLWLLGDLSSGRQHIVKNLPNRESIRSIDLSKWRV